MNNVVATNRAAILSWFTGKSKDGAIAALDILEKSESKGEWMPGARTVKAALGKSNIARKLGKKYGQALEGVNSDYKMPRNQRGWEVMFTLMHAQTVRGQSIDFDAVHAAASDSDLKPVIRQCERYVKDFAPIIALIEKLDNTRPEPVITYLNASPTITKLIESLGLVGTVAATIRLCPIQWELVEFEIDGKKYSRKVGQMLWPEGTIHGASRYAESGAMGPRGNCHACGHAIKNPFNWVPLIIDNKASEPFALWVGCDCAKTLFGVSVKGPMEFVPGQGAQ